MDERGCNDLNDGKDADLEDHLLYQVFILQKRHHAAGERLGKVEPGHQSGGQEHQIRNLHALSGQLDPLIHDDLKNHKIHGYRHHRLHHGPDCSHIGTGVAPFEIVFGQPPDQPPVGVQLLGKLCDFIIKPGEHHNGRYDQNAGDDFL